jgi:hypothetical protein
MQAIAVTYITCTRDNWRCGGAGQYGKADGKADTIRIIPSTGLRTLLAKVDLVTLGDI